MCVCLFNGIYCVYLCIVYFLYYVYLSVEGRTPECFYLLDEEMKMLDTVPPSSLATSALWSAFILFARGSNLLLMLSNGSLHSALKIHFQFCLEAYHHGIWLQ